MLVIGFKLMDKSDETLLPNADKTNRLKARNECCMKFKKIIFFKF